jgi:phage repressor protein C with HTH and peptisase S24 domain
MTNPTSEGKQADVESAETFPVRLKQALGDQSIRGFARECGFSDTVLRQYLNGQSEPTRPALLAIARTANVNLEWLAAGSATIKDLATSSAEKYTYKDPLAFKTDWLQKQFPDSFDNLLLTQMPDDSMEPTLHMGDLVLIDTRDRDLATVNHGIYLIKLGDRILVKRLQYIAGKVLRVLSDHSAYETFAIVLPDESNELSLMGKIVWSGQKL